MKINSLANRQGFTLIEIAIVLTIAGLVVSGIWMIMSTVAQNAKESRLVGQVSETMGNARRIFSQAAELPNVSGTGPFTTASIAAGVFPPDMVRDSTTAIHALGSNTYLSYAVSNTPVFNLTLAGLQPDNCTKVVTKIVGSAAVRQQYGITGLIIGGSRNVTIGDLDVPVSNLVAACSPARRAPTGFNVTFQFTIL
ncbi:MAG TPA: prepilin-type N-terminal cleavage/methylation domain-containing protein [Alphaproteobacteria bacterium]|nr:prepilin-type N-terminal cleavage/methylation domain-containing protein [Alphaproteobacteria bacterium]